MYILRKSITIECAHQLFLPYDSPCNNQHGHTYHITLEATGRKIDENGMVCDFADLAAEAKALDHTNLNDFIQPSTAEMLAWYLYQKTLAKLDNPNISLRVFVKETESSEVLYYE